MIALGDSQYELRGESWVRYTPVGHGFARSAQISLEELLEELPFTLWAEAVRQSQAQARYLKQAAAHGESDDPVWAWAAGADSLLEAINRIQGGSRR